MIHSPRFMREEMATEGSVHSNPLHHELLEIALMARHDFMLDVTLTRSREISGIFAGEPIGGTWSWNQFHPKIISRISPGVRGRGNYISSRISA